MGIDCLLQVLVAAYVFSMIARLFGLFLSLYMDYVCIA